MQSKIAIQVKNKFGDEKIKVLEVIFNEMTGKPPSINLQRFKATNDTWMTLTEELESDQLIRYNNECKAHVLFPSALLLLENEKAKNIVQIMAEIFVALKPIYKRVLSESVGVDEVFKSVSGDENSIRDALYYMREMSWSISGCAAGFPYDINSKLNRY